MAKHRFSRPSIRAAACMCLLACGWSAVQAQMTAKASIESLKFSVTDLRPLDGVAAGYQFNGGWYTSTTDVWLPEFVEKDGVIYDMPAPQEFAAGELLASQRSWLAPELQGQTVTGSIGQAQASSGLSITKDRLLTAWNEAGYVYDTGFRGVDINPATGLLSEYEVREQVTISDFSASYSQGLIPAGFDQLAPTTLTVMPGTKLVIKGTLKISGQADLNSFAEFASLEGVSLTYAEIVTQANVGIVDLGNPDALWQDASLFQWASFDQNGLTENSTLGDQLVNFEFAYSNQTRETAELAMDLVLESRVNVNLSRRTSTGPTLTWLDPINTIPTTPVIPEPSTWALMGLGMAAVSWAARRRTTTTTPSV